MILLLPHTEYAQYDGQRATSVGWHRCTKVKRVTILRPSTVWTVCFFPCPISEIGAPAALVLFQLDVGVGGEILSDEGEIQTRGSLFLVFSRQTGTASRGR